MPPSRFWTRIRQARLVRVLVVYLAASWLVIQVTGALRDALSLPEWISPVAFILLLVGLVIISATAWVQSHPHAEERAAREEIPGSWELDLGEMRDSVARGRLPHLTWSRALLGGLLAFSLLFGLAGGYVLLQDRGRAFTPREALAEAGPALAVLPFRVVGPDVDLWREGMVDLISTNVEGAVGLRAIAPRTLLARWHAAVGGATEPTDEQALEVARAVGARFGLIGSLVALGGEVRLSARLYDLRTGKLESESQVKGHPDSIPALVDRLSIEVLRSAAERDEAVLKGVDLRRVTTSSLPALKAYLAGEQHFRRSRWKEAIAEFERALEADSTFALAAFRLSVAHGWFQPSPVVTEYGERAARWIDRLTERDSLLVWGNVEFDRGLPSSIHTFERLTARYPDDAEGWYALGEAYLHVGIRALYPHERFRQAFRRTLELDPSFGPAYIHLTWEAFARGDSARARELIDGYRKIDPDNPEARAFDLAYALGWGDPAARERARAALDTTDTEVLFNAGVFLQWSRELEEAALQVTRALAGERHPLPRRQRAYWGLASIAMNGGRIGEARRHLLEMPARESSRNILLGSRKTVERTLAIIYMIGYEDDGSLGPALDVLASEPDPQDRVLMGGVAARRGNWDAVQAQVQALEAGDRTQSASGDSTGWNSRAAARALSGYAAGVRGDRDDAIADLEQALPVLPGACPGYTCYLHAALRYELGRLLLEEGRAQDAERWLKSLELYNPYVPPVELQLGKLYEELGDVELARTYYARFVRWWENCDPELRPLLEEGRQALKRLEGIRKL